MIRVNFFFLWSDYMSDHDSYYNSNSNCIFTFMSYQTYTRSTVQMAVQTSGDIMNMEGISCEFSVKIPLRRNLAKKTISLMRTIWI